MDAKDTVIEDKEILAVTVNLGKIAVFPIMDIGELEHYFQAQAEITWAIAFKAGRREVVEWLIANTPFLIAGSDIFAKVAGNELRGDISYYPIVKLEDWRAKLKEWGIE